MLQSRCHIIATLRSKMEHVQVVENGKTVVKKVGLNPIQRDGLEYEFTVFLDLDYNHTASATKDRTGLFDGLVFKPGAEPAQGCWSGWKPGWKYSPGRPGTKPDGGGRRSGRGGSAGGTAAVPGTAPGPRLRRIPRR